MLPALDNDGLGAARLLDTPVTKAVHIPDVGLPARFLVADKQLELRQQGYLRDYE